MKNSVLDKSKTILFFKFRMAPPLIILFGIFSCSKFVPIDSAETKKVDAAHSSANFTSRANDKELVAFKNTLYPVLSRNCSGCHNSASLSPVAPLFADDDAATAFTETMSSNLVNFVSPSDSFFVMKVQSEFHYCWSGATPSACYDNSLTISSSVEKWSETRTPVFSVDSGRDLVDALPGDGICQSSENFCTLRAAIQEANMSSIPVTIKLFPSLALIELTLSGLDDTSARGDLDILRSMRIEGVGADKQIIQVNSVDVTGFGVFHVSQPSLTGIFVKIEGVTVRNGSAPKGAGVYLESGNLVLDRVVVDNNRTLPDDSAAGAGIYQNAGTLAIRNSTVSNNSVDGAGVGGGVFISENAITAMIVNSTISGNSIGGSQGAGVYNASQHLEVSSTTITNNIVLNINGQGSGLYSLGNTKIKNSLVAQNYLSSALPSDCSGIFLSGGYNLVGVSAGCLGFEHVADQVGTVSLPIKPFISVLSNNGGPTPTHALGGESYAINSGDPVSCSDFHNFQLTLDQRGVVRPAQFGNQSPRCDIGSFEFGPISSPPLTPNVVAQDMSIESGFNSKVSGTLAAYFATNHKYINFGVIEKPVKGNLALDTSSGFFTYTPGIDKGGVDGFTFVARTANNGVSLRAVVNINILNGVAEILSPPVTPNLSVRVRQGQKIRGTLPTYDLNGDILVFTAVKDQASRKGKYSIESRLGAPALPVGAAMFEYVANPIGLGEDSFEYAVSDGDKIVVGVVEVIIVE